VHAGAVLRWFEVASCKIGGRFCFWQPDVTGKSNRLSGALQVAEIHGDPVFDQAGNVIGVVVSRKS
jgi:hypothetical protein